MVEAESISRSNTGRTAHPQPLCSIFELLGDIMLNCGCKCLIFSELSGLKIELFDFSADFGTSGGCFGKSMNTTQPKLFANRLKINKLPQRVTGVTAENEPKRAGATLKNFF